VMSARSATEQGRQPFMAVCSAFKRARGAKGRARSTMTNHDYNRFRIHPGHTGEPAGHPTGPYPAEYVWLLRRNDDKLLGTWDSRHAAVGALATARRCTVLNDPQWFTPVRVPAQSVRTNDVIQINE